MSFVSLRRNMDNFIFDLGGVLLNLPVEMAEIKFNGKVKDVIINEVCLSEEWANLDRGTLSEEEATEIFVTRYPEYASEIKYFMENWVDWFEPKTKTVKVLQYLKNNGKKLYILSNFHKKAFEIVEKRFDFFNLFDGGVVSADVKLLKPEIEIYKTLIDKYSLDAEKTVFIDDNPSNVEAAKKTGITSVLAENLDQALNSLLEMVPV